MLVRAAYNVVGMESEKLNKHKEHRTQRQCSRSTTGNRPKVCLQIFKMENEPANRKFSCKKNKDFTIRPDTLKLIEIKLVLYFNI